MVQLGKDRTEDLGGLADVDHDVVGVQCTTAEGGVHHERGAVQALGRTEHLAPETVRDHHVVSDGDAVHVRLLHGVG